MDPVTRFWEDRYQSHPGYLPRDRHFEEMQRNMYERWALKDAREMYWQGWYSGIVSGLYVSVACFLWLAAVLTWGR